MTDIIKTWPANVEARTVAQIFSESNPPFCRFFFTLGRGKPKQAIANIWFTYQGRILGSFEVEEVVCNDGTLPRLSRLDGGESEWQIRKDAWVAVCAPPCKRIHERVFHEPFRGWRYFNFQTYKLSPDARVRF
ncbi:MAG TPA: hypothetical protein VGR71_10595 [Nitrospira sp.]|nr:hypothetical protein [Nitrospira sp.]